MKIAKTMGLLALVGAAYVGGYGYGRWYAKDQTPAAPPARRILYYIDPMHPAYKSDKPGVAPDCGMKLEPVYADGGAAAPAAEHKHTPDKPGLNPETGKDLAPAMPPGTVQISPEKQQLIGVRYGAVEFASGGRTIRAVGKVSYDETRIARVHTKVEGWIDKVFVDFTGDLVKKGQPLLTLYSPEMLATQREYLLAVRSKEVMKQSTMAGMAHYSDSLLEASRRRLELWDLSESQIEEITRKNEPLKNITVYSPISGYVMARNAFPNQKIMPDTDLYTIVDLSKVWVMADVFEYEAPLVRMGQAATITLPGHTGRTLRGRVSYLQPQVDPVTRTLKVRLELNNPGTLLKPEMFADVEFRVESRRLLTVPVEAVLDSGRVKTVFVDRGEGRLEPRQVETGERMGERVEIVKGLTAGERVVTSGNFLVDSESRLKSAATGMTHQH
jgi:membrane fusion protein, copper/silver efflux system